MLLASCRADSEQASLGLKNKRTHHKTNDINLISNKPPSNKVKIYAKQFNHILLAELYNRLGYGQLSATNYKYLLSELSDVSIAKRATVLAATSGQQQQALAAVRLWVSLAPENIEARQYYSLLLLRHDEFAESVKQLHFIRTFIDEESGEKNAYSKGLKFIGSMLNIESHHKQALAAYQQYIQQHGEATYLIQQNLILSSLAMNADQYALVLSSLNAIDADDFNESSRMVLMKVEALQKLKKKNDAISTLKYFVDQYEAKDSIKLQLVRLLIQNQQKNVASPYLKDLVKKHPDNNDLLKSLIALEIDQAQLKSAKVNIKKLKKSKDYHSDAAYFMGEISEAEGDVETALKNYQKVIDGNLQKRALKKILRLSERLNPKKTSYKGK